MNPKSFTIAALMNVINPIPLHTPTQPNYNWQSPPKPLPKGTKVYEFPDGFRTVAISQKSADRKHIHWAYENEMLCYECGEGVMLQQTQHTSDHSAEYQCHLCGHSETYP